jgi:hypothetical protein
MIRRKNPRFNRNTAIVVAVIVVMLIAIGATILTQNSQQPSKPTNSDDLKVGDTFTYKLTGSTVLGSPNVVIPEEIWQYNETAYYKVTVTSINGTQVLLSTLWQFNNGTQITRPQIVDLSNGAKADPNGFWALYSSNLNVKDLLHPKGTDGLIVNSTDTQKFADSSRTRNYWATESQFVDNNDTTGNTMRNIFVGVYFDKQTGMLDKLTHIDFFTNPEIEIIITWELTSSSVWAVQ